MRRQRETIVAERKRREDSWKDPRRCCCYSASSASGHQRREALHHARWDSGWMKPDKSCNDTAARLCQLHMEAGNSLLATASTHRGQHVTRHKGGLTQGAGNVGCYCCCYCWRWSSLGVGCRCSDACTTHVKYLQQLKQKKSSKERLSHAELCGDSWVTSLYHGF